MRNLRFFIYCLLKPIINKKQATQVYLAPYLKIIEKELEKNFSEQLPHTEHVWTMWLQEDVPEVIQICINKIRQIYPNAIIINEKNIDNFVTVPQYIKEKFNKKQISAPHYSDYIRCLLLEKHGGLWLDSSLYMLDSVPKFITKQDFFILTDPTMKSISNFFIYSRPNNTLIKAMRIFLEKYWEKENSAINYFFFHHFFMLLCKKNQECKNIFSMMKHWTNAQVRYLADHSKTAFDADLWDYLTKTSFMYKINRKDLKAMSDPNSFFQHIIKTHNQQTFL